MRIDKFLNSVNIVKNRATAQDMIASNVVFIQGILAKASREVRVGDVIEIRYLERTKRYEVLAIPAHKSTPKSQKGEYVSELD